MRLKTTEDGAPVLDNGNPVYIFDNGTEKPVDVSRLFADLKTAAEDRDKALADLKAEKGRINKYNGIDPEQARKDRALVETLKDKNLDPDEITTKLVELKSERDGLAAQLEEVSGTAGDLRSTISKLTLSNAIKGSSFVREKMAEAFRSSPERVERLYGHLFEVGDDGTIVPLRQDGAGRLMSKSNPSQPASVDEALEAFIGGDKTMLRAGNASGPGAGAGNNQGASPSKPWAQMTRVEKVALVKERGTDAAKSLISQQE